MEGEKVREGGELGDREEGKQRNGEGEKVREERKEIFLFNDALNTFYLRLHGVTHMVKDHSDRVRGNPLPPHGLLFLISS